jgi:Ca2+-binding RTX toxin-like protein
MEINVLLRGQSNAGLLARSSDWGDLATRIDQLLGFDGKTNKVNLLEKDSDAANDNTVDGGTAFIGDWVQPVNGNWQNGWTNNTLEQGLLNYIAALPADERAAPTAIVWLQNEYDSTNAGLTTPEWMSAVSFEAQQVRDAFGQSAASTPYVFVNAIPYGDNLVPQSNQAIKLGMELLAANPAFHATVGAQADDVNMDYGQTGIYGGPHMTNDDADLVDRRLAVAIAEEFAQYAQPGSPVATGQVDGYGPEVMSARHVGTNQVLATVALDDHATLSPALSADAANGVGWSIIDGGQTLNATAAQVTDANHVLLTFNAAVPGDASAALFYAYGYGRLALGNDPGQGNAIYDAQNMPLWAPATGVPLVGPPAGEFAEQNLVTGGSGQMQGFASSVPGYQSEFAAVTPDSVAVTAMTANAFLVGGLGADVLTATAGNNLLEAGAGSTLMIGGGGNDTFVIVGGGPGAPTWDAIGNFHPGDSLVLWGAAPGNARLSWTGAQGMTVLTVTGGGIGGARIGFVGISPQEAQHFATGSGSSGGMDYLTITRP